MMEVKRQNIINKKWFLVVCILLGFSSLYSQNSLPNTHIDSLKTLLLQQEIRRYELVDWSSIQKNRQTMPIFCKWELDIQDATKMPVKFRLGSQEYVDRMESKGTMKMNH